MPGRGEVAIIVTLLVIVPYAAQADKQTQWPDGPNKLFLESLQRPDNHLHPSRRIDPKSLSCCDVGDTVKTKFMVEIDNDGHNPHPPDRWYAWLEGEWRLIPDEKIVPDFAPDGQAYLFMMADTIQCFVRPRGGL
jgi:hypothetical protein